MGTFAGLTGLVVAEKSIASRFHIPICNFSQTVEWEIELNALLRNIFNLKNVGINDLFVNERLIIADDFEVLANNTKNNIFDISEIVIERLTPMGFDCSDLRKGTIPEGLEVHQDGIKFTSKGNINMVFIPELRNYDATIKYINPVVIKTILPQPEWKYITKIEKIISNINNDVYESTDSQLVIFVMKKEFIHHISVEKSNPLVVKQNSWPHCVNKVIVSSSFSPEIRNIII